MLRYASQRLARHALHTGSPSLALGSRSWAASGARAPACASAWRLAATPGQARHYSTEGDEGEAGDVLRDESSGSESSVGTFAVVQVGGKQYKVCKGDVILADKLVGAEIGDNISLNKVLLVGSVEQTVIGTPKVEHAKVLAEVQEQTKAEKILIFKKKRRKGYKRLNGARPHITTLKIQDVVYDFAASAKAEHSVSL